MRPRGAHTGSRREYDVLDDFVEAGFWYIKSNRSGQAIKQGYALARIPGDLFCWHPRLGGFQIEVGGTGKRVASEIAEMRGRLLIGFTPLVVLFRARKREYCLGSRERYPTLDAMLDALENR